MYGAFPYTSTAVVIIDEKCSEGCSAEVKRFALGYKHGVVCG